MIGRPRVHFRLTDSTNERARELAAAGAAHGTLVTADEQRPAAAARDGHGARPREVGGADVGGAARAGARRCCRWPRRSPYARPASARAVATQIKWPNDVWIDGAQGGRHPGRRRGHRKAGRCSGIGLNVARHRGVPAASCARRRRRCGWRDVRPDGRGDARRAGRPPRHWLPLPGREVLAAWRTRDALIGRPVRWENGGKEGIAAGIDASGALVVDTADGQVTLDAGEVHLER